jgi:hypothetical protein
MWQGGRSFEFLQNEAKCTTHNAPWSSNAVGRYENSPPSPVQVILIKVVYVCLV